MRCTTAILLGLSITACDVSRSRAAIADHETATSQAPAPAAPADGDAVLRARRQAPEAPLATIDVGAGVRADRRMIIRTADMRVRVDSLERSMDQLIRAGTTVGALVSSSATQQGEREQRSATIELKASPENFDRLLAAARRLGSVDAEQISVQDVGEEYVDIEARVANGRRLEQRLLGLLAAHGGRLTDILAVERELARVRQETDGHEGRRRYLQHQLAFSTLRVSLYEPGMLSASRPGVVRRAVAQAGENFVNLVAIVISAAGIVVPVTLVGLLCWLAASRFRGSESGRSGLPAA